MSPVPFHRRPTNPQRKRMIATGTTLALLVTLSGQLPLPAMAAAKPARPTVDRIQPVPVHPLKPRPAPTDPTAKQTIKSAPTVTWPSPGYAETAINTANLAPVRAGRLPVLIAPPSGEQRADDPVPARVGVRVMDRPTTERGRWPFVVRLTRADGVASRASASVTIDYAAFRHAYGGDWAGRLRMVRLPECAFTTPESAGCTSQPLPAVNDLDAGRLSSDVQLAGTTDGTVVALTTEASSSGGDYSATPLSASSTWSAGGSSGDFNWSYPLRVPPGLGDLAPQLALSYSSQSVDGRTAASNNQPSWAGEGFNLDVGSITRSYKACKDDGQSSSEDQCWGGDNATLTMSGRGGELIADPNVPNRWHLSSDDGSKVEKLFGAPNGDESKRGVAEGEYWKITGLDGTQYFFGLNQIPGGTAKTNSIAIEPVFGNNSGEPCNQSSFADSYCNQAYRWNLDYVVDPHGNTTSYWYTKETNHYARNKTDSAVSAYDRAIYLSRIEYGTRQDASGNDSHYTSGGIPARVQFEVTDRCITAGSTCTTSNTSNWPDVPSDLECTSTTSCPGKYSPSFWTRKKLSAITTQVASGSGSFRGVDRWTLTHEFKAPNKGGANVLWLDSIKHGDAAGSDSLPAVAFMPVEMNNRVDTASSIDPIVRFRMSSITNETGGTINVTYSAPECVSGSKMPSSPDTNTMRCFPVYYTPAGSTTQSLGWFHKYVVTQVTTADNTTGNAGGVTNYTYLGSPAWHYDQAEFVPASHKSWGQWRGYGRVRVTDGAAGKTQSQTETIYFRGMNGDKTSTGTRSVSVTDSDGTSLPDEPWRQGMTRETITYNGTGDAAPWVSKTKNDPWEYGPTATRTRNGVTVKAYVTGTKTATTKTALDGGRAARVTATTNTFDNATGRVTMVDDAGDTATAADDQCTRTTYAENSAKWMYNFVARTETVKVNCGATPDRSTDVVSDVRTFYDGSTTLGTVTKGDVTQTDTLADWNGGSPRYVVQSRAVYDPIGRAIEAYDALGNKTATAYTPAGTGPVTATTTTNPMGWTTTTNIDPAWGVPTSTIDENGKRTDLAYDSLGRLKEVWLPGRAKGTALSDMKFAYMNYDSQHPAAILTSKLNVTGEAYITSSQLFDGFARATQTQTPSPNGGSIVSDTLYDSRGLVDRKNNPYPATAPPGNLLLAPVNVTTRKDDTKIPGQTQNIYDNAERLTNSIFRVNGVEKWRTTIAYGGDRVDTTPPAGGTASSVITDARGRTTERWQYHDTTASGGHDTTHYTYTSDGKVASVTDAAGTVWRWSYDQRGRMVRSVDPDKGTTTSTYNDGDQLTSTTDARGTTIAYTYDQLGRKTASYLGSTAGTKLTEWVYDTIYKGQKTSSTRYAGGNAYTLTVTDYDDQYRPLATKASIPAAETGLAGDYVAGTTYNADGSVATVDLPTKVGDDTFGGFAPETLTYGYHSLGMPTTLSSNLTSYVTSTQYDELGRLSSILRSSNEKNVAERWGFEDGTNRLAEHVVYSDVDVAEDSHYQYDDAGNITSISNRSGNGPDDNQCFRYDSARRLTEAWTPPTADCTGLPSSTDPQLGGPAPYWQSFTYDAVGNRTSSTDHTVTGSTTRTYSYPAPDQARPHAVSTITDATHTDSYGYDSAGNTATRPGTSGTQALTWDAEGHLATSTEGGMTTSYIYDADGNRLLMKDPDGTTLYLGGAEYRRTNSSGAVSCTRYYSLGTTTIAVRSVTGLSWQTADPHNTAQVSYDAGTLALSRRYSLPFGAPRGSSPTWSNPHGFVNGVTDATGLTHLGAREYDPGIGRFVSVDPVFHPDDPQQINGYSYSGSDPVNATDPSGLSCIRLDDMDGPCSTQIKTAAGQRKMERVERWRKQQNRNWARYRKQRNDKLRHQRELCQYHGVCPYAMNRQGMKRMANDILYGHNPIKNENPVVEKTTYGEWSTELPYTNMRVGALRFANWEPGPAEETSKTLQVSDSEADSFALALQAKADVKIGDFTAGVAGTETYTVTRSHAVTESSQFDTKGKRVVLYAAPVIRTRLVTTVYSIDGVTYDTETSVQVDVRNVTWISVSDPSDAPPAID